MEVLESFDEIQSRLRAAIQSLNEVRNALDNMAEKERHTRAKNEKLIAALKHYASAETWGYANDGVPLYLPDDRGQMWRWRH
jgi:regulator of replication initiation timing